MLKRTVSALAVLAAIAVSASLPSNPAAAQQSANDPNARLTRDGLANAADWELLARRTTVKVLEALTNRVPDFDQSGHTLGAGEMPKSIVLRPIYIRLSDSAMPFGIAFKELLTRNLMDRDKVVVDSPRGATVLNIDVYAFPRDNERRAEVIVSTEVTSDKQALMKTADIFYIRRDDLPLYANSFGVSPGKSLATGVKNPPEATTRNVRVTAR